MSAFVDIHSHILWGLDDGPGDLTSSLEMLQIAVANGTTDIVATPHSDIHFSFQPELIESRIRELGESAGPKPRIHRGCDFHLHFDNVTDCLANPSKYTINHLRYLMVEFPDINLPRSAGQIFERMLQAGITPVITHPERNANLVKDLPQLIGWIHEGCLLQVTAQSFLGRFGKQPQIAARELMNRGMVHFIASDAHDTMDRTPDLSKVHALISKQYSPETAQQLFFTNPVATLTGELFPVEMPHPALATRKWFQFW